MSRDYKIKIESAPHDFEGLGLECRHAKKTLKALKKRDYELATLGQELKSGFRVWLASRIVNWQGKVDELNHKLVHWRAEKAAKKQRDKFLKAKKIFDENQRKQEEQL